MDVEVGTIGYEGFVGLPLFHGSPVSPHAAFCRIAGRAARFTAADLHRFTQTTMVQLSQNVACSQTHTVEQRAARCS